jgi:hypothetical protein
VPGFFETPVAYSCNPLLLRYIPPTLTHVGDCGGDGIVIPAHVAMPAMGRAGCEAHPASAAAPATAQLALNRSCGAKEA